jgi:phenylpropionate dioxygenase-like ring-hydroxylating dioxygenase large terminal subunit
VVNKSKQLIDKDNNMVYVAVEIIEETTKMITEDLKMYEGSPWCLGSIAGFEVDKPHKITLLGIDYVIWKDVDNIIHALDNICPHFGASLGDGGQIHKTSDYCDDKSLPMSCLWCPYHGHQVQLLSDGRAIIEGNLGKTPIQNKLNLVIKDGLVWTYGQTKSRENGRFIYQNIAPKAAIPDYSNLRFLPTEEKPFSLLNLYHNFSKRMVVDQNISLPFYNLHDGEHFGGSHVNTMMTEKVEILDLDVGEHDRSWTLRTIKKPKSATKGNKYDKLIEDSIDQKFYSFTPGFGINQADLTAKFGIVSERRIFSLIISYPESLNKTSLRFERYVTKPFTRIERFFGLPESFDRFSNEIFQEDLDILSKAYSQFDHKIRLKNDTPLAIAMDYLKNF